ncbi:MAG: hypothetical protein ABJL67_13170 [Sulfitobacter sp.]
MTNIPTIFKREHGGNDAFDGLQLGDLAKDTLTGFQGILVAANQNISGCDQVAIQPISQDGKFEDCRWFDVERVAVVDAQVVKTSDRRTGADVTPQTRTPTSNP